MNWAFHSILELQRHVGLKMSNTHLCCRTKTFQDVKIKHQQCVHFFVYTSLKMRQEKCIFSQSHHITKAMI